TSRTASLDRVHNKLKVYARAGVGHLWIVARVDGLNVSLSDRGERTAKTPRRQESTAGPPTRISPPIDFLGVSHSHERRASAPSLDPVASWRLGGSPSGDGAARSAARRRRTPPRRRPPAGRGGRRAEQAPARRRPRPRRATRPGGRAGRRASRRT